MRTWVFWIFPALLLVTATMTAAPSNHLAKGYAESLEVGSGDVPNPGNDTINPEELPCPPCGPPGG